MYTLSALVTLFQSEAKLYWTIKLDTNSVASGSPVLHQRTFQNVIRSGWNIAGGIEHISKEVMFYSGDLDIPESIKWDRKRRLY